MAVIHEHVPPLAGQRRMGYGAAKAALMALCEGLLLRCHGEAFAMRIIKAGFMATPMTGGKAPPALRASPESMARDLLRRPVHIAPGTLQHRRRTSRGARLRRKCFLQFFPRNQ